MLKLPTRLMSMTRRKLSRAWMPLRPRTSAGATPAQLARPWRPPKASSAVATAWRPSASLAMSAPTKRAWAPSSAALAARLGVDVGQHHLAALLHQHLRGGGAEPGATAGDQEHSIFDTHVVFSLLNRSRRPPGAASRCRAISWLRRRKRWILPLGSSAVPRGTRSPAGRRAPTGAGARIAAVRPPVPASAGGRRRARRRP